MRESWLVVLTVLGVAAPSLDADLSLTESGTSPARKLTVNAPGVYKAVVCQESGGGIMEFYDLVVDPEAKRNLAGHDRGLFEIG